MSARRHKICSLLVCFCFTGKGAGVHIYVIDSGTRSSHDEFNGRFSNQGYDVFASIIGQVYKFLVIYLTASRMIKQDDANLMWRTQ